MTTHPDRAPHATAPRSSPQGLGPLRCTVVTPFASLGGSERWLLGVLDAAGARLRAEVWLLEDGPLRGELTRRGVPVVVLPTGTRAGGLARRAADLTRRLRRSEADLVLANGVKAAAVVVPAARLTGVPVCWAKHDFSWDTELAPWLGRLADGVLATSEAVAAATHRPDAVLVPPPRPSGQAAGREEAKAFWATHGVALSGAPTVAMLTRLVGYKGVDTAITALADDAAAPWQLVVAGPDDPTEPAERDRLQRLADELGVAERVCFPGEVADAGRHLAAFDAVAVLTRSDGERFGREGYSIVALEALAAGVPLVGAGGNPEVERMALVAGRVVPPGDAAGVAQVLFELREPEVRERCAAAAAQLIAEHPDAETCASLVVDSLARVARRPGAGLTGPPVSVLTCFRNEEGHIDGVVGAVLAQLGPDDEYLLLDDGSTDKTPVELDEWAARDSRIRLLNGPAVNLSAARNAGFALAKHDVVVCTDAGCVPGPDWLAALRAPFAAVEPPSLVVGVYDVDGGDPVRDASRIALFPSIAEARRRTPLVRLSGMLMGRRFSARRLDGRSMACAVEAWHGAGGFDVRLYSSEDAVFGEAVLGQGGTSVLALDGRVTWEQTGSLLDGVKMYHKYGEWGGRSGSWPLVGRDLARGVAYLVAAGVVLRGDHRSRAAVAAGAAAYLAVPLSRVRADPIGPGALALVPVALVAKDLAKASGTLHGGAVRVRDRWRPLRPPE